jgi:hypothetical protein
MAGDLSVAVVSPAGARSALDEMLEMIPANKISTFGGDIRS